MAGEGSAPVRIGVLGLQGAFREHIHILQRLGVDAFAVRTPADLATCDGLVLPGGESTTMGLIAERNGLLDPLRAAVPAKLPMFGTCAGLILLADRAVQMKEGGQALLGGLDVVVDRNHFGTQLNSFEADIPITGLAKNSGAGEGPGAKGEGMAGGAAETVKGVFIRAPAILEAGPTVEVLSQLTSPPYAGEIVAVRQEHLLATAFHPELTPDTRWHEIFIQMVQARRS